MGTRAGQFLKRILIKRGDFGLTVYDALLKLKGCFSKRLSDEEMTALRFRKVFGREIDLEHPVTLNEKIQWLKLNVREDIQTVMADKYGAREYIRNHFGEEYLVPLLFVTSDWRDITLDNLPDEPCIVKPNHGTGCYEIIRDKNKVDILDLRVKCLEWLNMDFYRITQEWPYRNIKRKIIVEKLLQTREGTIPNDYKLNYINGKLEFIYCSVGRESENKRNIYDADWKPLYFSWVEADKDTANIRGKEIAPPATLPKMMEIGERIARNFAYVRVDFYDVDGRLYIGEITFYHGGGFDVFVPSEYDEYYGKKLILPDPARRQKTK